MAMTPELLVLALALLLQVVQYILLSVTANLQLGTRYTTSPRDEHRPLTGIPARLERALQNHFEALTLFTPAVLIVTLADQSGAITSACAWSYLAARILYIPAYAYGWVPVRSLIWAVGFFSTIIMLIAAFI
jgi:uncharacterized MAPEG superfamily protein